MWGEEGRYKRVFRLSPGVRERTRGASYQPGPGGKQGTFKWGRLKRTSSRDHSQMCGQDAGRAQGKTGWPGSEVVRGGSRCRSRDKEAVWREGSQTGARGHPQRGLPPTLLPPASAPQQLDPTGARGLDGAPLGWESVQLSSWGTEQRGEGRRTDLEGKGETCSLGWCRERQRARP